MILTRDESIIMPIIEDLDIRETFNDGLRMTQEDIEDECMVFMIEDGCLFVARVGEGIANIHAAVPKSMRGKKAVKAAKICLRWLADQGYTVISTIERDRKDVRLFARLCGMTHINDFKQYRVYTWAA